MNHHHHHISVMELGHLLIRSGLTYPEVSSKVCQLGNSVSLPRIIHYEAFYIHVVSSFSCIPVICPILVLFLIPLQFVCLFCIECIEHTIFTLNHQKPQHLHYIQMYAIYLLQNLAGLGAISYRRNFSAFRPRRCFRNI
jgi:hypothetical protein